MALGQFFSDQVCAGGCGNLMPRSLVEAGRRYLYGHKGGCPAEGEPIAKRRRVGRRFVAPPPGPVQVTNFRTALELAEQNLDAVGKRMEMLVAQRESISALLVELDMEAARLDRAVLALRDLVSGCDTAGLETRGADATTGVGI